MSSNHNHNRQDHKIEATAISAKAMRMVTTVSVSFAMLLLIFKAIVWWRSHSMAMLASLADTALDLVTSSVMFMAVRYAVTPADDDHRFGHGKAEALAALVQAVLTFGSGIALIMSGGQHMLHPQPVSVPLEGITVSVFAIVTTFVLVLLQKKVVRDTGSVAIEADHVHYIGDLWLNLSVIVALALASYTLWHSADGFFAVAIGVYFLWGGWRTGGSALDMLMDREWSAEQSAAVMTLVTAHKDVRHVHELRTRTAGLHKFAQFHIWVDPHLSVMQGHDIAHAVETELHKRFPQAEFLIHVEPDNPDER